MTNLISMDKRYKTRDGRDVRVLCTDNLGVCAGSYPVVAIVEGAVSMFTAKGGFHVENVEHDLDLIEQPQEHSVWIELCKRYGSICSYVYETEEDMYISIRHSQAQNYACPYTLLATKKVVVAGGEFCS